MHYTFGVRMKIVFFHYELLCIQIAEIIIVVHISKNA